MFFLFVFPFVVWFSFVLYLHSLLSGFCQSILYFWFVVIFFQVCYPLPISICLRLVVIQPQIHFRGEKNLHLITLLPHILYNFDDLFYIFVFILLLFSVVITFMELFFISFFNIFSTGGVLCRNLTPVLAICYVSEYWNTCIWVNSNRISNVFCT